MKQSILLVEDDSSLGATISEQLESHGYLVTWSKNCAETLEYVKKRTFSLGILDVGLPDGDGFTLAQHIEKDSKQVFPFMFLTAMSHAEHRLKGFELGAVDFIPKPFHLRELLLRIKRILTKESDSYRGFQVKKGSLAIITPAGESVSITQRDFTVLQHLIDSSPDIVSRDELIEQIGVEGVTPRTIDNSIVRLRAAFSPIGSELIHSVRGIGYQWQVS